MVDDRRKCSCSDSQLSWGMAEGWASTREVKVLEFARELADSLMWKQIFLFLSFKKTAPFPLLIDMF